MFPNFSQTHIHNILLVRNVSSLYCSSNSAASRNDLTFASSISDQIVPLILLSGNLDQLNDFNGLEDLGVCFFGRETTAGAPGGGGTPGGGGGGGTPPMGGGGGTPPIGGGGGTLGNGGGGTEEAGASRDFFTSSDKFPVLITS